MNKDYFKPVKFNENKQNKSKVKSTPKFPNKKKFTKAINLIRQEFEKIATGTSEYSHYAIVMKDDQGPATVTLAKFEATPTIENMKEFLDIAEQEFGLRVKKFFEETLNTVLENNNV